MMSASPMIEKVVIETPVGSLELRGKSEGLTDVIFLKKKIAETKPMPEYFKPWVKEFKDYFKGTRRQFTIPVVMEGTDFQKKVWKQMTRVFYGKTASYEELAKMVGHAEAVRAVGTTCRLNRTPIVVPCHRIINKSGALGGYLGGLKVKKMLLALESQ